MLPSCNSMAFGRAPPRGGALPYWLKERGSCLKIILACRPPMGGRHPPPGRSTFKSSALGAEVTTFRA